MQRVILILILVLILTLILMLVDVDPSSMLIPRQDIQSTRISLQGQLYKDDLI